MARQHCPQCQRPNNTCYCDLITATDSQVLVTLLQHPKERKHPKGTAPLLKRSLHLAELHTGEIFCPAQVLAPDRQAVLLFPPTNEPGQATQRALKPSDLDPANTQLIVLDGTWRKTRKILFENPWLQPLPRLQMPATPDGRYSIRKAENSEQLSTLEACCYALAAIDTEATKYAPLLAAFDAYIARLSSFIPPRH